MKLIRRGTGTPLLMVHGLGGHWQSWNPILDRLTASREVVLFDLPGHGKSPAEPDSGTFNELVTSVEQMIAREGLGAIDMVGSSMGGRIVLELARRGGTGAVVALDPGGFWEGWERGFFKTTIAVSVKLLRTLRAALPKLSASAVGRTALLAQLTARPWALDGREVADELDSYAGTGTFDALVADLDAAPMQRGPAARDSGPVTIGWGRHDRLCLPRQAQRAVAAFPSATLHWFEHSGHFPHWEEPEATATLILSATS
ncbi:MAG: alpha/beta fold hydrolase [Pseudomonadota bacterium]|nr:alpha/beta fold hydrolase [Pseudomonadota bacterium]